MIRKLIPFFVILLLMSAAVWKTRSEVLGSWKSESSTRWVEETSSHNPELWLADPRDVAIGRDPVRPIREPVRAPPEQTITMSWPDGDVTDAIGTPHGREEPATDWLSRRFETVDFARRFRR